MNTPPPELETEQAQHGDDDDDEQNEDRPESPHGEESDASQIESEDDQEDMSHECVCTHPSHVIQDSRGRVWVDEEDEDIGSVQASDSEESDIID
jgi:hypothetical protein